MNTSDRTKSSASSPVARSHGGRPSLEESEQISARILEAARTLILRDDLASTSMDAIAAEIGISKRTLYARHASKAALFEAMVIDLVRTSTAKIVTGGIVGETLREKLHNLAVRILTVITDPLIIALDRVVTGESQQFPRLAELIDEHGGDMLQREVADVLRSSGASNADWSRDAEIFLAIVILQPLRKAVLKRTNPGIDGVDRIFLERSIDIFIRGIGYTE